MCRLTNEIRESIRKQALSAAFKQREDDLKATSNRLGMEAYEAVFSEAERKAAAKMPDGWLRKDSCLRFNANGWTATLNVSPAVPVPSERYSCSNLGNLTGELAERVQAYLQDEKGIREDRWKNESEMDGFLSQFKTIKQLRDAWPEGEPYFAKFDVERKAGGVPAIRVAEINKMLHLAAKQAA